MFDIGMAEMVVIGVVALIVVGPKDLPQMFRRVGQFVGKARGMARDFQRAMDQAADDSGVGEVTKAMKQATSMKNLGLDDIKTSMKSYQDSFEPKKVDAAAEHAARVRAAEEANKAAEAWTPPGTPADTGDVPVVADSEVVEPAAPKKTATRKAPAKRAAAKKPAAKKPAAKSTAARKPATRKAPAKAAAKKPAAKKPAARKTAARKTPKSAETKA